MTALEVMYAGEECPRCDGEGYIIIPASITLDGAEPEEAEPCPVCRCPWAPTDPDVLAAGSGEEVVF